MVTKNKKHNKIATCDLQFIADGPCCIRPQEFEKMKDGETIYKLTGPVLLKQDKVEADSTVKGRIEFIKNEV